MELNEEMADPEYWSNPDKAQIKNKELKQLEDGIKEYEGMLSSSEDIDALISLGLELEDESTVRR